RSTVRAKLALTGPLRQSGFERIPGEKRALYSRRKPSHAGKSAQRSKLRISRVRISQHQIAEFFSDSVDLVSALALHQLRHHRRRGLRYRASAPREFEIAHRVAGERHLQSDLVAAERILHLHAGVRVLQSALVP